MGEGSIELWLWRETVEWDIAKKKSPAVSPGFFIRSNLVRHAAGLTALGNVFYGCDLQRLARACAARSATRFRRT